MVVSRLEACADQHKATYIEQLSNQFKQATIVQVVSGSLTISLGLCILAFEPSDCTRGKAIFPAICFFFGVVWLLTACNYFLKYRELGKAPDAGQDYRYFGNAGGDLPVAEAVALPADGPGAGAAPTGRVVQLASGGEYVQPALTVV